MEQHKKVKFQSLGVIDYQEAWDYQEKLHAEIVEIKLQNRKISPEETPKATPNYLLFCQHPHVYTLGKSGKPEHLLLDDEGLEKYHAQYFKINRGGDITYHGYGQLVGYPIFDLENFFTDIHRYMRFMEEAVIRTCADYGIEAGRIDGLTGVWIDYVEQKNPRKICAMGVKASRWVTMHGFALNVNTDLSYFSHIVPCGIDDKAVTSIALEVGREIEMAEVESRMLGHLKDIFEFEIEQN
ncbi:MULTISPECIES: lipoyl(octanoyl) transferase LipB [Flectobacillus]|uniref:Octanoyltransferase n=1 Tax=Flectobacillus roseus TaxID=502259 RepID=A0ABT6YA91_9BACT|nr:MULTISPECIES: lipoyl(octanoyl) transferase LipB [Flectobacillus]MDI9860126.1 lipoyl(octanoyl) transferase LipB [Flectobacillus roseus]NBA77441.1 lipoyl(octanoyl) transferase LipB [Emticicia sp. ODNR4P]PAC32508.1 lipoyl(octanoyl) transferase [Flectobacillus sp. BAB-3569]